MKTNNNIPAYRFQGYTDAWELRPLGEIGNTYTGLSGKTKDDFGHGDGRFVTYMNVFSNPISLPEMVEAVEIDESQNTVRYGDVLFTTSSETPEEVGMSSVWLGNTENTYLNSFCFGFRPVKKVNPYYLAYLLRSSGMRRKISFLAQGISRYNISKTKMMELEISIPNENEQSAIGTFFSTLDRHITLHQRKLDTLKQQKKTYLKLLFPAKGQTKPALRFQGFEDDWEIKRISDIGDIVTGNTPSTSNEDYYSKEGMMWVTPTDIDGLIITDTNKKLSPEGEKVSRIVPANSILVTCIASIGKNTLLLEAGSFNQQINAVVPNQSLYYPYFLLTQSYFWSESMKRIAPAATMQIINKNEFSNITVPLPSVPEQEAIGTFFQTLDQEITQVEVKLASLKEMKKTLLRKLFV
ncbi:type IC specificity subunit [Streptococcus suis]|uniref:Type IC specificity subunit n=1 Tax=Streptococcus suis TaxID=1307 RepID=A0A0Z8GFG6_STRSU|nr:restriction endonuclease subunit S [Streptococcus suis]NQH40464.1 restriction endonuclease subunit S [Streptococcus suis]CYU97822.1 type IC specificity subunit [Streptococcus suis]